MQISPEFLGGAEDCGFSLLLRLGGLVKGHRTIPSPKNRRVAFGPVHQSVKTWTEVLTTVLRDKSLSPDRDCRLLLPLHSREECACKLQPMAAAHLLRDFEQQYASITGEITHKLSQARHRSADEKRVAIRDAERMFEECRELFEQMELEVRSLGGEERSKYSNRLQSYKAQVQTLQQDLNEIRTSRNGALTDDLMGGSALDLSDQRALLLDRTRESSDQLDRTTLKLDQGYRIALETEQIGAGVLGNLGTQRESLNKARSRLTEMEHDLGQSSRVLSVMVRRAMQNRAVIIFVVAVLLIIIAICIYFAVRR